jgi:hypothetical protein
MEEYSKMLNFTKVLLLQKESSSLEMQGMVVLSLYYLYIEVYDTI